MHVLLSCEWAVIMTLSVVFCLCPSVALSHLGSALRTGAGTLTKIALGNHIVYCTFSNLDGKPPMLSHVRVSREPQYRISSGKDDSNEDSILATSRIRSPSYQHKVLQFHSTGQTGNDYYHPKKLIVSEYPSVKSLPAYPVPSKYGKLGSSRYILKSPSTDDSSSKSDDNDDMYYESEGKWAPRLLPEPEDPTFTPYIGARALTNMNKFFEHLRENLEAIYEKGREQDSSQQGPVSSNSANDEVTGSSGETEEDADKSSETEDIEKIATPTRRGYSSKSEPTSAQSVYRNAAVGDRGDLTNRDSRSASSSFILANRFTQKPNPEFVSDAPDEKTRELLHFLGHGRSEFARANKYNPGWLFTNLGLGKRSHLRFIL